MVGNLKKEDVDVAIGHDLVYVAAAIASGAASCHRESR